MAAAVLLLAAEGVPLAEFFNPAARMFRLPAVEEPEFEKLPPEQQLLARGFAPGGYHAPPEYDDSVQQAMTSRVRLFPGFAYAARLSEKRRFWRAASEKAGLDEQIELLERLPLEAPAAFLRTYAYLAQGVGPPRRPSQALLALRHSERQFRRWWVADLGRAVREAPRARRLRAVRALSAYLRHEEDAVRLAAARVLGMLEDEAAVRAVERALGRFDDPPMRAALVAARAAQGGDGTRERIAGWIADPEPAVSRAAIGFLREDSEPWSLDLLQDAIEKAEARLFEDLELAITARNGARPAYGGPVDFYGLKTRSRRIVFCIDVSLSMDFPMDGHGGTREPRRTRTVRELARTIERLPEEVSFNVIFFSQRVTPLWRRLRPAGAKNREAALAFVRDAGTEPGTDMAAAIGAALRSGADTAYLLTDGEPSVGRFLDPALILHEAAAGNRDGKVKFHAVGLSRDQNVELLFNLARASGGRYLADR